MKNPDRPPLPFFPMLMMVLLLLLLAGPFPSFAAEMPLDWIEVTVNQAIITHSELQQAMDDARKAVLATAMPAPTDSQLRKEVLDQLIDTRMQLQLAKDAGISATSEDVEAAVEQIAGRNGISTLTLYQKIGEQGMIADDWRKMLRDQILIQKVQQEAVGSTVVLSPDEVAAFARTPAGKGLSEKDRREKLFDQKYQKAVKQWVALNRAQAAIHVNRHA